MFKVRTPRYLQQPAMFEVGILLTYGNHLHDRIISLRGSFWSIKLVQLRHFLSKSLYHTVMYVYVWYWYRLCLCFYHFSIRLWNCSDSLVMLFYLSYYFTFWNCSDSLVMLFYLSYYFTFWNCSDSLVMLLYLSYYFTFWNCSDSLVMLFYLSYYFTLSAYQMRMIGYS